MVETVTAEEIRSFLAETLTPERCAMSVIVPPPADAGVPDGKQKEATDDA